MGLETGSTISSFITSNPTSSDPVNQGDDHLRLIKSVLQAQFPGVGGLGYATAITATEAELNALHGFTNVGFAAGTRVPFAQASAPTGWTQDITDNATNRMLRVVNTAGNGIGGTDSPILNNTVPSHTHTFTGTALAAHTHTDSGHSHSLTTYSTLTQGGPNATPIWYSTAAGTTGTGFAAISSNSAGTPAGTNAANASAADWAPRYIDLIICSKN
jgi:hypothetical protein